MTRSTLPFTMSGIRVFESAWTNFTLTPSSRASSLARSTSNPSGCPVSLLMKPMGGKSYFTPTIISPRCFTVSNRESAASATEVGMMARARATRAITILRIGDLLSTTAGTILRPLQMGLLPEVDIPRVKWLALTVVSLAFAASVAADQIDDLVARFIAAEAQRLGGSEYEDARAIKRSGASGR